MRSLHKNHKRRFSRTSSVQHAHVDSSHVRRDFFGVESRMLFVGVSLGILIVVVFARVAWIQTAQALQYAQQADAQHQVEAVLSPYRGSISLLQGDGSLYPAAVSRLYFTAYIQPGLYDGDTSQASQRIAEALELDPGIVAQKFLREGDPYEVVKKRITKKEKELLDSQNIDGLHFTKEAQRYYPGDSVAAHVIGFVGYSGDALGGRYGIERMYEEQLLGEGGSISQLRDARGRWHSVSDRLITPQRDGASVVLTIEQQLQQAVERILAEDALEYGAESAVAVVSEVSTGRILAMAQTPTFSLNTYNEVEDYSIYTNHAVSVPYESGSVFKTFTLAMGLDAGVITPDSTYVDEGFVEADVYTLRNAKDKVYGLQTMTQVLEESINTGVIHAQKLIGNGDFRQYTEDFGFGVRTNIELPGEVPGNFTNLSNEKRFVEYYTASYGQGVNMTPIQLTSAYGALANDGILMRPTIIDRIQHGDGSYEAQDPQEIRRVISSESSFQIGEMLHQVVAGGHARLAGVPGYRVGGKTGTAQSVTEGVKGYDEDRKTTTFVGYAPIPLTLDDEKNKPQYVVFVKYDNPENVEWAASSAAPTFGKIMSFLLDYKGIEPTDEDVSL